VSLSPRTILNRELARRQKGYGRGAAHDGHRSDKVVEVTSGIRWGEKENVRLAHCHDIRNKDWEKWEKLMSVDPANRMSPNGSLNLARSCRPHRGLKFDRQGHPGRKFSTRASATAKRPRVWRSAPCARKLLDEFGIRVWCPMFVKSVHCAGDPYPHEA